MNFGPTLRRLWQRPGFAIVAVVLIALGIGVSTSMFSITNSVLLRPAGFPEGDQLVRIFRTTPQSPTNWVSPASFLYVRSAANSFSGLAAFWLNECNVSEKGQVPEVQTGLTVTANFLSTLGVRPLRGRDFAADEDAPGRSAVMLLTESYWKKSFGSSPGIVGRTLHVGTEDLTVIGVLPDFDPASRWYGVAVVKVATLWPNFATVRTAKWFDLVGRLKPGVTLREAQAELNLFAARLDDDFPADNGTDGFRVLPLTASDVDGHTRLIYWLMVGLATMVELVACANLAGLQLARAHARAADFAVHAALGATRFDLVVLSLVESLAITLAGGMLGTLLGFWTNRLVSHYYWGGYPIPFDGRVVAFACLIALATGLSFGLAPAWLATRVSTGDLLKEMSRGSTAGRTQHRFKFLLVVGQLASALILVSAALSFALAIRESQRRGSGWQAAGLFSGFIDINHAPYKEDAQKIRLLETLSDRLGRLPGVTGVALTSAAPFYGYYAQQHVVVEGYPPELPGREPPAQAIAIDDHYLSVVGIPLRAGRGFAGQVRATDPRQIMINEAMARQYWPDGDAIGKRVRFADENEWNEVIGVVGDVRIATDYDRPYSRLQIYRALAQAPTIHYTFVLKSAVPPDSLTTAVRKVLGELDPDLMLEQAGSLETAMRQMRNGENLMLVSLTVFAALGMIIALVGLYAVITQLTQQRRRELGIRIALGASYPAILRLVLAHGVWALAAGLVLGLGGAIAVGRIYQTTMPELPRPGPVAEAVLAVMFCLAGLLACYFPARRAARTDPVVALRSD